jgi:lipid-binding SYLF domain-containing protein
MSIQRCIDGREVSDSMKAIFLVFAALLGACSTFGSGSDGLQSDVDQAVAVIERFEAIPEKAIPPAVMRAARGVAILTVTKVGFIGSVRGGTGVVVARIDKGWSGPSAIGTGGIGAGLQAGAEVSELVIVLNTPAAVDAFSKGGNVTLSAALGVAAGPVGRTAEAGVAPQAAMYTYSRSQGLFAGISLEGTVIATRDEANEAYYGRPVTPREILSGKVQPPQGAKKLQQVLSKY